MVVTDSRRRASSHVRSSAPVRTFMTDNMNAAVGTGATRSRRASSPSAGSTAGGGDGIDTRSRSGWRDYRGSSLSRRMAFELSSDPRSTLFHWLDDGGGARPAPVSYTHLRAHET